MTISPFSWVLMYLRSGNLSKNFPSLKTLISIFPEEIFPMRTRSDAAVPKIIPIIGSSVTVIIPTTRVI